MARGRDFFEAQRRHRRATWRLSVLSALAVAIMGLPLSVVVSPLLLALVFIVNDLIDLATPTPDLLGDVGHRLHLTAAGPPQHFTAGQIGLIAALLLVPGVVIMLVCWESVRRLFHRVGAGAVVLSVNARPPKGGDLEEHQLVNIVDEMALAAGVPSPTAMVLDSDMVNAVAVGRTNREAVVVVPKQVLEQSGRAPTEAIVGELVSSIVNGDLKIALTLASVFETFGLMQVLLSTPFSREGRRILWKLVRLSFGHAGQDEPHILVDELIALSDPMVEDDNKNSSRLSGLKGVLQLPFTVAAMAFWMVYTFLGAGLVRPVMGRLWRRRRLLADATAVQLTRDPDALYDALEYLQENSETLPAGPWQHLFVVGGRTGTRSSGEPLSAFQPPMNKRLANLVGLGANRPVPEGKRDLRQARKAQRRQASLPMKALGLLLFPVFIPLFIVLMLVCGWLLLCAMGLMVLVSFAIDMLFVVPVVLLVHQLVRH